MIAFAILAADRQSGLVTPEQRDYVAYGGLALSLTAFLLTLSSSGPKKLKAEAMLQANKMKQTRDYGLKV